MIRFFGNKNCVPVDEVVMFAIFGKYCGPANKVILSKFLAALFCYSDTLFIRFVVFVGQGIER